MLVLYYQAIKAVPKTEEELLSKMLLELEASLDPGFNVLNWNSLGISDFNHQCHKAINEFNTRVGQVLKNKRDIEALVASISNATLVPEGEASEVPTLQERFATTTRSVPAQIHSLYQVCRGRGDHADKKMHSSVNDACICSLQDTLVQEFYDSIETHRVTTVEALVKMYRTIPQLLGKMEEVVAGTNSGRSPTLVPYYHFWELCIFNALNTMVLQGMETLSSVMQRRSPDKKKAASTTEVSSYNSKIPPALFRVRLSLSNPEILVSPTLQDMSKMLSKLWRNMVESTKMFVRWMHGTCVETPEQHVGGEDEEPFIYSFYNDVQMNPVIIKSILSLDNPIRKAISSVKQYAPDILAECCLFATCGLLHMAH
jgi:dynein heavy chain, axonemal